MDEDRVKIELPREMYYKIKRDILNLYIEFNVNKLPIDVFSIARKMGFELRAVYPEEEMFSIFIDKGCLGFTLEIGNRKVICYRADVCLGCQRFTVAHEIAHVRMGHKEESELAKKIADTYAANLLVPEVLIHFTKCKTVENIYRTFEVSYECAEICLSSFDNWLAIPKYRDYEIDIVHLFGYEFPYC